MVTKYQIEIRQGGTWHIMPLPLADTATGAEAYVYSLQGYNMWRGYQFRVVPVSVPE